VWGKLVFEKRGGSYDSTTEDVYVVELDEDFREDFDGEIEQLELGGHVLISFGNSNSCYEPFTRLFPASI
jgi:hypothetical protein